MPHHDPVPHLRLQYLILLGLLLLVFVLSIVTERIANESRLSLKTDQVDVSEVMGEWYDLRNYFARFMLTDTFFVTGIEELKTGLDRFDRTLASFEEKKKDHRFPSEVLKFQTDELVSSLREGLSILTQTQQSFQAIILQLSPEERNLYATMSLKGLSDLYDKSQNPPASYLQIKRASSENSGFDLYFSEVFEGKRDRINQVMKSEMSRLDLTFFLTQMSIMAILIVASGLFFWQILGINSTLVTLVHRKTEDLQHTLDELQTTQEVLLESRRQSALSNLIVGLAHEINTPLGVAFTAQTALQENLNRLKDEKNNCRLTQRGFDEALAQQENLINLAIRNLHRLNDQIAYFRTLSASTNDFSSTMTDLKAALIPALEQFQNQASRRSVDFQYTLDAPMPVITSPQGIIQIVSHLFQNSMDHAFPETMSGIIRLEMIQHADELVMDFHDTGLGIPDDVMGKIMEPFFTTARAKGHMGLGLNIIHNLVSQQFHGTFEFRHPSQGFGVHLVLKLNSQESLAKSSNASPAAQA